MLLEIRSNLATTRICQKALQVAEPPQEFRTLCEIRAQDLNHFTAREKIWLRFEKNTSEIEFLCDALLQYSKNPRQNIEACEIALHFRAALEDVRISNTSVVPPVPVVQPVPKEIEEARREEQVANRLRDEMLHEVFMGGPRHQINIWGQPTADTEADKILTGDRRLTYNEDMQIEGAKELLKTANHDIAVAVAAAALGTRRSHWYSPTSPDERPLSSDCARGSVETLRASHSATGGVIVGTVSGFMKKLRES